MATRTYWAISVANSKTMLTNGIVGLTALLALLLPFLSLPDVAALVPARYLVGFSALMAVANLYIRTQTVRPVAWIAPGTTTPVEVPALSPPAPPRIGD